jgi:cytochrome P450
VNAVTSTVAVRPVTGFAGWLKQGVLSLFPVGLRLMRRLGIVRIFGFRAVTTHDDVREVFGTDAAFNVVYTDNLNVITDGQPFFLGLRDSPEYRAQLNAMRAVVVPGDLAGLGDRAEALAEAVVAASGGRVEVVSLIRSVVFGVIAPYFGVPEPAQGRLDVWATRLFEFQFTGTPRDRDLRADVDAIGPVFRAHIDGEIARRKASAERIDDVLGRCLALQAQGVPGYGDGQIRTALLCMVVGGPPQPPMVVPQAMEQLLRRPGALKLACDAAAAGDDAALHDVVLEAMRFDPLAPALPRKAVMAWTVARGTSREAVVPSGASVMVGFASAMMDPARVSEPGVFRPGRPACEYIHFGYGLHACFGFAINHATLHRMVKPLLRRPGVRRAGGAEGRLRKAGIFSERLVVLHD